MTEEPMNHKHYVDNLTPEDMEAIEEALELDLSDRGTAEELTGHPDPDIEDLGVDEAAA